MASSLVFVTVGTTEFDLLIQKVVEPDFLTLLHEKGYCNLLIQFGNGQFIPEISKKNGVEIDCYRFKESLADDIAAASLIITHGGAGSCFEILAAGKPAIVVVNDTLMGNHQTELADVLSKRNYAYAATPQTLLDTLQIMDIRKLKSIPPANPEAFLNFLNDIAGLVTKSS